VEGKGSEGAACQGCADRSHGNQFQGKLGGKANVGETHGRASFGRLQWDSVDKRR
jgi:hypothetical protein